MEAKSQIANMTLFPWTSMGYNGGTCVYLSNAIPWDYNSPSLSRFPTIHTVFAQPFTIPTHRRDGTGGNWVVDVNTTKGGRCYHHERSFNVYSYWREKRKFINKTFRLL